MVKDHSVMNHIKWHGIIAFWKIVLCDGCERGRNIWVEIAMRGHGMGQGEQYYNYQERDPIGQCGQ